MAFEAEKRQALHPLERIENGDAPIADVAHYLEQADPALVYFILTWLRERYVGHPAAEAVLGRVVELSERHPRVQALYREGKTDPIVVWFEEEHSYRDFTGPELISVVVEKLEG